MDKRLFTIFPLRNRIKIFLKEVDTFTTKNYILFLEYINEKDKL